MPPYDWPRDEGRSASEVGVRSEPPVPGSLFLRLPPELRDHVYNLVLGQRTIHILSESFLRFRETGSSREIYRRRKYYEEKVEEAGFVWVEEFYTNALSYSRCYEPMDEHQAYAVSQQVRLDDPFGLRPTCKGPIKGCRYCKRHHQCWCLESEKRRFDIDIAGRELALLVVSSQLQREAEAVLYRNTTFSFNLASTLKTFVESLTPTRSQQVKTLHLEMSRDAGSSSWSWESDDIPNIMKALTGLTSLHINIRPVYLRHSAPQAYQKITTGILTNYHESVIMLRQGTLPWWEHDLAQFRHQKLQCVTVILEDDNSCPLYTESCTIGDQEVAMRQAGDWTLAEKAGLARFLGEKLLASWNAISADDEIANSAPYMSLLSSDDTRPM